MQHYLQALPFRSAAKRFIQPARSGLHPHLFKLAAQPLDLVILCSQLCTQPARKTAARRTGNLRGHLRHFRIAAEAIERPETADRLDAPHAGADRSFSRKLQQSNLARRPRVRSTAKLS